MKSDSPRFAARIGLDWADQKHDLCLKAGNQDQLEYGVIQHSPESIAAWADALQKRFRGRRVAICLELKTGPVVSALLKYPFITLFPISPRALARYRESFSQSGAKDDPTDAFLQLDYLLKHPDSLRPLIPEDPRTRILQQLVEDRREFVQRKVDLTNTITSSLKAYYPQALQWFNDIDTVLFCDFMTRWSTLAKAQTESEATLRQFFKSNRCGREDVIARRVITESGV